MAFTRGAITLLDGVAATGAGTALATDGTMGGAVCIALSGTFSATVTWQGTVDGDNWFSIQAERLETGDFAATATATGIYRLEVTGLAGVRPNVTSYSSGSVTARAFDQAG